MTEAHPRGWRINPPRHCSGVSTKHKPTPSARRVSRVSRPPRRWTWPRAARRWQHTWRRRRAQCHFVLDPWATVVVQKSREPESDGRMKDAGHRVGRKAFGGQGNAMYAFLTRAQRSPAMPSISDPALDLRQYPRFPTTPSITDHALDLLLRPSLPRVAHPLRRAGDQNIRPHSHRGFGLRQKYPEQNNKTGTPLQARHAGEQTARVGMPGVTGHARATPAPCPRHARATQASKWPKARATPAPCPHHARATVLRTRRGSSEQTTHTRCPQLQPVSTEWGRWGPTRTRARAPTPARAVLGRGPPPSLSFHLAGNLW
eukprot:gene24317-biopygen10430